MASTSRTLYLWTVRYIARPTAIALISVGLALALTYPLQQVMFYPFVFLFFGAILFSAWFGGVLAGLEAVVLSSMAIVYYFFPPIFSLNVAKEFRSDVAGFVICAIAVTAISASRRRGEAAMRFARDELEQRVKLRTAELERSNLEIAARERQLSELTEAIPQQIWRSDAAGRLEYCNRPLMDYLGNTEPGSLPGSLLNVLHSEDAALFEEKWRAAKEAGANFEVQARVCSADGTFRWFLIRAKPQKDGAGEVVCWYGVHIDIEEQHRIQEAYLVSQDSLSRFSRTMSLAEMAASIAHELNQPLTALVADSHACRRWLTTEPINVARALATSERIVRECTRASSVVSRVRSLFMRSGYVREATNLNALIRDLMRLLRDDAIRRAVSIHLSLDDRMPDVMIDAVQMQQVILNLARNGMEAMSDRAGVRELAIRTRLAEGDEIAVSVIDSGIGVEEGVRDRIFEPFVTTKPDGTGMGLAICRSIVEAHGGRIWVEAMPVGTAFHFQFPTAS